MSESVDFRSVCDLCGQRLPENSVPYQRSNRKPGECLCFVPSVEGAQWND